MHDKQVVPFCDEIVRHVGVRPLAVYVCFLVKILGDASIGDDDHGRRAQLEREEAAVQLAPFGESDPNFQRGQEETSGFRYAEQLTHFRCVYALGIWWILPRNGSVGGPVVLWPVKMET